MDTPRVDDGLLRLDVCMPTWRSAAVLPETLDFLAASESAAPVTIEHLVVVDNQSDDATRTIVEKKADEYGWRAEVLSRPLPLQKAREVAIELVEADWFLFLDDDVRVSETYLARMVDTVAPLVGGIQGRKGKNGNNAKWVRWRSHRAGTHATLLRREAVESVTFPDDLTVLEDEYLRQTVEENGYLWVFNHQARFDHANRERHPGEWTEGYLAGKYGLGSFCFFARKIPASVAAMTSPVPDVKRTAGWIVGWSFGR